MAAAGGSGGSGAWNTVSPFWFNGATYQTWNNATLDDAVFGGTAGTVTLGGAIVVHNLSFTTTGYTVTGGTLTLGGSTPTVDVLAGGSRNDRLASGWHGGTDEGRHRHADADRRQHLHRHHDDQRRHAFARQWRHHRQRRRQHRRQCRAGLQPQQCADLCRFDQRHRHRHQERHRHADADRRQHLHRRHDDQRRHALARQWRHDRQRRRQHRRQCRAGLQPQRRADLCRL